MNDLLSQSPLWLIGIALYAATLGAAILGRRIRRRYERAQSETGSAEEEKGQEGYIVSAVLGLLALLLGFTFALAVDRFDARRVLVLEEANAITITYFRVQLLEAPHRGRLTGLINDYVDNRIELGQARRRDVPPLLAENDRLITEMLRTTAAAFPTIRGYDFSSTFLEGVGQIVALDATRKTARLARVPTEVFVILMIYQTIAAGVLGYALIGRHGRVSGLILIGLLGLSLLLIVDIDRPTLGGIRESQAPMIRLKQTLATWPPEIFDLPGDAAPARAVPLDGPRDGQ